MITVNYEGSQWRLDSMHTRVDAPELGTTIGLWHGELVFACLDPIENDKDFIRAMEIMTGTGFANHIPGHGENARLKGVNIHRNPRLEDLANYAYKYSYTDAQARDAVCAIIAVKFFCSRETVMGIVDSNGTGGYYINKTNA